MNKPTGIKRQPLAQRSDFATTFGQWISKGLGVAKRYFRMDSIGDKFVH